MRKTFVPQGVCSRFMDIEVEDGVIKGVSIEAGCDGNLQAISRLLRGMTVSDAIAALSGIRCGYKETSCPDQLARALKAFD
jgi:uncharacterized protein TIGR03905